MSQYFGEYEPNDISTNIKETKNKKIFTYNENNKYCGNCEEKYKKERHLFLEK